MDIKELEAIMIAHGVVLRAIPELVRGVYETSHANEFPQGKIEYLEGFKREMLIVERVPKHAGQFIFECVKGTCRSVNFTGKKYYDSIEEAIDDLVQSNTKT